MSVFNLPCCPFYTEVQYSLRITFPVANSVGVARKWERKVSFAEFGECKGAIVGDSLLNDPLIWRSCTPFQPVSSSSIVGSHALSS